MIGLKNRKSVEGWALDVNDLDGSASNSGLRQRLADNNKLWLLCFAVILGLGLYFIREANKPNRVNTVHYLPVVDSSSYDPDTYADFAAKFADDTDYKDILLKAPEFIGPEKFRLLVPGDTSRDDIEYTAKMAARSISHKFKHRVTVQVRMKRASGGETLVAYTTWDAEKGYSVKFRDETDGTFK